MKRCFSHFILAIDQIHSIMKCDCLVVEFSKINDF